MQFTCKTQNVPAFMPSGHGLSADAVFGNSRLRPDPRGRMLRSSGLNHWMLG
jgi:hypothetical protein